MNGAGEALEGVPVDASVQAREEEVGGGTAIESIYAEVPTVNAPSEPVWSLAVDVVPAPPAPTTMASQPVSERIAEPEAQAVALVPETPPAAETVPAPQPVAVETTRQAEPSAPPGPTRKGWWQRPFRSTE